MDNDEPIFSVAWPTDRPEPDSTPVRIRTCRPMLLLRIGEDMPRHADVGEIVTVPRHSLRQLDQGTDYEIAQEPDQPAFQG